MSFQHVSKRGRERDHARFQRIFEWVDVDLTAHPHLHGVHEALRAIYEAPTSVAVRGGVQKRFLVNIEDDTGSQTRQESRLYNYHGAGERDSIRARNETRLRDITRHCGPPLQCLRRCPATASNQTPKHCCRSRAATVHPQQCPTLECVHRAAPSPQARWK